jgi:hypothetical protein
VIESFKREFLAPIGDNKMNRIESKERLPGAPGEGMTEEQLKLDRYAVLMSFVDDAEIPVKQLAEQFQTNYMFV